MKRRLATILFVASAAAVAAFSSGPPNGATGAPGEAVCTDCHSSFPVNSGTGSLSVSGLPQTYIPGMAYTVTVNLADPNARRWGFEATAKANGKPGGVIAVTDAARTQLSQASSGLQYIKHTSQGTDAGKTGSDSWTFSWTAPAAGTGPVTFYAAGNAANGDGTPSGDHIYTTSVSVPEGAAIVYGDVTGDGLLTIADVTLALQFAVQLRQPTPAQLQAADVAPTPGIDGRPFGDGVITVADVLRMLRRVIGLDTGPWP